jgi:hypothetical protein
MASKKKKSTKKAAPKKVATIKIEPFTQSLACALKREEIEEKAQRAAHLISDRDSREAVFKEERNAQKNQLEKLDTEIRSLSAEVREKVTFRDVSCERRYVYAQATVQDVRLDTGEILSERPMSDSEKQRELDFDKKPGAGGDDLDDEFHEQLEAPKDGSDGDAPDDPPDPDTAPPAPGAKAKKPKDDEAAE